MAERDPDRPVENRLQGVERELRQLVRQTRSPATARSARADAERAVELAVASHGALLAGPWYGEVGYEVLYWIPFLNWAVEMRPQLRDRLTVVSRGGAGPWYWHLTTRYADVFDQLTPAEFLQRRGNRMKQVELTEFESELLRGAGRALGLEQHAMLHPEAMYTSMLALARDDALPRFLEFARPLPFVRPAREVLADELPREYVAVKFYFNASFPDVPANRAFVARLIGRLAERTHVVLLNTGLELDDHHDATAEGGRIISLDHLMVPANNLEIQSIAIAHATAFIGTYGGLSYLPPFYGVPSISLFSKPEFFRRHLNLAQMMFDSPEFGSYTVISTEEFELLEQLLVARSVPR